MRGHAPEDHCGLLRGVVLKGHRYVAERTRDLPTGGQHPPAEVGLPDAGSRGAQCGGRNLRRVQDGQRAIVLFHPGDGRLHLALVGPPSVFVVPHGGQVADEPQADAAGRSNAPLRGKSLLCLEAHLQEPHAEAVAGLNPWEKVAVGRILADAQTSVEVREGAARVRHHGHEAQAQSPRAESAPIVSREGGAALVGIEAGQHPLPHAAEGGIAVQMLVRGHEMANIELLQYGHQPTAVGRGEGLEVQVGEHDGGETGRPPREHAAEPRDLRPDDTRIRGVHQDDEPSRMAKGAPAGPQELHEPPVAGTVVLIVPAHETTRAGQPRQDLLHPPAGRAGSIRGHVSEHEHHARRPAVDELDRGGQVFLLERLPGRQVGVGYTYDLGGHCMCLTEGSPDLAA